MNTICIDPRLNQSSMHNGFSEKHKFFFQSKSNSAKECDRSSDAEINEPGQSKRKADEQAGPSAHKKRVKLFQQKLLSEFDWLRCADSNNRTGLMFCTTCEAVSNTCKSLKSNAFVQGSSNYQRSALTRHMESADHVHVKVYF